MNLILLHCLLAWLCAQGIKVLLCCFNQELLTFHQNALWFVPRTGVVKELGLIGSDRVEEASIDKREMQYLYDDGASLVFMDTETYDQIEIPEERVEWEKNFLKPSEMINIQVFDGEILGVILPDKVSLKITECEQAVKGDTATSAQKNAVVETGLQVKVPLFIQEGETIVVSTADGKYCSRAKD